MSTTRNGEYCVIVIFGTKIAIKDISNTHVIETTKIMYSQILRKLLKCVKIGQRELPTYSSRTVAKDTSMFASSRKLTKLAECSFPC